MYGGLIAGKEAQAVPHVNCSARKDSRMIHPLVKNLCSVQIDFV